MQKKQQLKQNVQMMKVVQREKAKLKDLHFPFKICMEIGERKERISKEFNHLIAYKRERANKNITLLVNKLHRFVESKGFAWLLTCCHCNSDLKKHVKESETWIEFSNSLDMRSIFITLFINVIIIIRSSPSTAMAWTTRRMLDAQTN